MMRTAEQLQNDVEQELRWEPSVRSEQIGVSARDTIKLKVSDGWVTLYGTAEWQFQQEEARRIFGSLLGVRGVSNEVQLKPKMTATDVKAKIEDALRRNAQIDAESITVETNGSAVILRGQVHSRAERQDAEHVAFDAPGVSRPARLPIISATVHSICSWIMERRTGMTWTTCSRLSRS
jgi:osmotically-inducible protein OsmY